MAERLPRKLVCVLHADVAGFSRLTTIDDDGTFRALETAIDTFTREIVRHGGKIANRAGDALLVSFESAYGAITGAVAAQKAVAETTMEMALREPLLFRVGINIGDVIESGTDLYGHGVNVAQRLETLAEPGGICISEAVLQSVPSGSGIRFAPLGEKKLKNIAGSIPVYYVISHSDSPDSRMGRSAPSARTAASKKLIVLPFPAFSNDPQQGYLADGFCEDLITELSRFRSFAVLARTTSFAFKGTNKTIGEIGSEVGADYALEGSFRPLHAKMRINAQLIETASQDHLWADKYDCDTAEIFTAQDTIVSQIASILESRIVERRLRNISASRPQALDAFDCWLRGHALMQSWGADDDDAALSYFERAIEIDPEFARAHGSIAAIFSSRALLTPGSPLIDEDIARAQHHADIAVKLDPADGKVWVYLGWVRLLQRQFDRAAAAFNKAAACNPNDADIAISRSLALAYLGDTEAALQIAAQAFNLNPYRPHYYLGYRAVIHFLKGDYVGSRGWFDDMPKVAPVDLLAWSAAAAALDGNAAEARKIAARFLAEAASAWRGEGSASRDMVAGWLLRITPVRQDRDMARLRSGLELAGLL